MCVCVCIHTYIHTYIHKHTQRVKGFNINIYVSIMIMNVLSLNDKCQHKMITELIDYPSIFCLDAVEPGTIFSTNIASLPSGVSTHITPTPNVFSDSRKQHKLMNKLKIQN